MKPEEERLLAEALRLPAKARAAMAGRLLSSLDEETAEDPREVQSSWAAEVERRRSELASGAVEPLTSEEALHLIASDDPDDDR